ncbi:MAG: hypothetical protein JO343_11700 [Candidatus Eremiobacteraeota bacterium]|nr:hypothetical protein [Candidatus Eremiobacteraeota bacterium]MBV8596471.1 hypothetical protein [Candidatus Eremiobacteraeota bacterium]
MAPEQVNLTISALTLVVLLAAAVAAIIQLRHLRASSESATFSTAFSLWYSPEVQRGLRFIQHEFATKMEDPVFRRELDTAGAADHLAHPELNVLDYFDNVGIYVVLGTVREAFILHPAGQLIANLWETLSPVIAIVRRKRGKQMYISFEYLAARARKWIERYPDGYAPRGFVRLPNPDIWRQADMGAGMLTGAQG